VAVKFFEKTQELLTAADLKEKLIYDKIRHRNILECFGWTDELTFGTTVYLPLIFELGLHDLEHCIKDSWSMPLNYYLDITKGLNYLHYDLSKTIVHRDIKPENIIVFGPAPYILKLADFGLSEEIEDRYFYDEIVSGTINYLA
jgi:serine/threonine protein kinase